MNFIHQFPGALSPGVTTPDANSDYTLNVTSFYARDAIDITNWLQIIGGVRFDRFDKSALDKNTNTNRTLVNNNVSPQAAVIVKPMENMSVYADNRIHGHVLPSASRLQQPAGSTLLLTSVRFVLVFLSNARIETIEAHAANDLKSAF